MRRWLWLLLVALVFSQTESGLKNALCNVYLTLKDLLPPAFLVAIIGAGFIYAIGQILPAEMRAKATSWAANIVVYTVIAALVIVVIPWLVMQIIPSMDLNQVCVTSD
jgi:hypothetical protein